MFATAVLLAASMVGGQASRPSEIPQELIEDMKASVGRYSVEVTTGDTTMKGRATIRLSGGGHGIIVSIWLQDGDARIYYDFVSGWDSSTGGFTDQAVSSQGEISTTRWKRISSTESEGVNEGTADGLKTRAKAKMERKSPDEVVVSITERMRGEKEIPDMKIRYRRIPERKK
jgi:hypothetical protein